MRKNYKEIFELRLASISGLTGIPVAANGLNITTTNGFYHLFNNGNELTHEGYTASEMLAYLEGLLKGLQFKRK